MKTVIFLIICVSMVFSITPDTAHIHLVTDIQGCTFPDILPIQIHILDEFIRCNLVRNNDVSTQVPVYIIQPTENGKTVLVPQKSQLSKNNVLYQNKEQLIAVLVKCSKLQDGQTSTELEGSISYNGKEYTITKSHRHRRQTDDNDDEEYSLHELPVLPPQSHDYKIGFDNTESRREDDLFKSQLPSKILPRYKRETTDYYIDIIMVIDFSIYRFWYLKSTSADRSTDALNKIRLYYAIVANGMNLRYKNIEAEFRIHVRLAGLIIAETSLASSFSENLRESTTGSVFRYKISADNVLEAFKDWVTSTDSLPFYDHMMLFTRYDLYSKQGRREFTSTAGLAYISRVCETNGLAISVVEDEGGYQSIETAAHELGHSLGAKHDGFNDTCSDADRYIMTAGSFKSTPETSLNPWKFSSCSINYFREHLSKIETTSRGPLCLLKTLTQASNIPEVTNIMPGQLSSPDEICQQIYSPSSRFCKGVEFGGNASDICLSMFCLDPITDGSCYKQTAPRGMSCGDNKWCIDGQCVYDFRAPNLDETCPWGDVKGIAFNNKTCADFVSGYPAYCYQDVVKGRCCGSCSKEYIGVYGCEYGDKGYNCNSNSCGLLDTKGSNYSATCCGTCDYRIPEPSTTTRETTIITNTSPVTSPPACVDTKDSIIGDSSCQEVIFASPELCYNSFIVSSCCESCQFVKSDNLYCPYGNTIRTCDVSGCGYKVFNGAYYDESCCQTCNYIGGIPTPAAVPSTTATPTTTKSKPSTTTFQTTTQPSDIPSSSESTRSSRVSIASSTISSTTISPTSSVQSTTQNPCVELPEDDVLSCMSLLGSEDKRLCYNSTVSTRCCQVCTSFANLNRPDCLYGDRRPEDCKIKLYQGESCADLGNVCCESCRQHVTQGQASPSRSYTTLVFFILCSLCLS